MKIKMFLLVLLSSVILSACSTPAPNYSISIPSVQKIKLSGAEPTSVGEFTSQSSSANNETISIRGNPMVSPKGTFAGYVQNALITELTEAKIFDPKSATKISATLIKNDISAAGFITASGEIEARFVVSRGTTMVFDKIKRATIQWDSSFLGAVAIPRAQENYPKLVTALLNELYADDAFFTALKK
jgi:hypothetical protein